MDHESRDPLLKAAIDTRALRQRQILNGRRRLLVHLCQQVTIAVGSLQDPRAILSDPRSVLSHQYIIHWLHFHQVPDGAQGLHHSASHYYGLPAA